MEKKMRFAFTDVKDSFISAVAALVLGVVFLVWPDMAINFVVYLIGIVLLVIGLMSVYAMYRSSVSGSVLSFSGITYVVFGVLLLVFPDFFVNILMYMFALLLLVFGIGQALSVYRMSKISVMDWKFYGLPAVTAVCGIVLGVLMFTSPGKIAESFVMLLGVMLIVYAASAVVTGVGIKSVRDKYGVSHEVKDVDYTEVK